MRQCREERKRQLGQTYMRNPQNMEKRKRDSSIVATEADTGSRAGEYLWSGGTAASEYHSDW